MNLKSFLSIPLAICLLCSSTFTAAATSDITNPETEAEIRAYLESSPSATTTNEYDILKEQQDSAHAVLDSRTASEQKVEDAKEILSFDPVEHFYDLQDKGKAYLEEQGYPADQIEAIMEFDGSEDAIYRASASLTADLLILNRDKHSDGKRMLEAKYIFSWSGIPSMRSTDSVALAASNFFYTDSSGASVVYYAADSGSERLTEHPTVKKLPKCESRAAGIDLSMQKISNRTYYHPVSGYVSAEFNSLDFRQTNIGGTYAHAIFKVSASPSASLTLGTSGTGASVSVRFDLSGDFKEMGFEDLVVDIP